MKYFLSAILALPLMVGCGSSSDVETSEVQNLRQQSEATLEAGSLKVTAHNGGFNPEYFSLQIAGRVMLGSNPCMAAGKTASFRQERHRRTISVVAKIRSSLPEDRICTREYNPVYADVVTFVHGSRRSVKKVIVKHVGERDQSQVVFGDQESPTIRTRDVVVNDVHVVPANGGFNPQAFAYNISGQVILGGNPCMAQGVTAAFETRSTWRGIQVVAVLKSMQNPNRVCTMEYNPVFETISTSVYAMRPTTVTILNVGEMGQSSPIESFLR